MKKYGGNPIVRGGRAEIDRRPGRRPQRRHRVRQLRGRAGLRALAGIRGRQEAAPGRRHHRFRDRRRGALPLLAERQSLDRTPAAAPRPWRATVVTLFPELFPGPLGGVAGGRGPEARPVGTRHCRHPRVRARPAPDGGRYPGRRRRRHGDARGRSRRRHRRGQRRQPASAARIYLSPRGEPLTQAKARASWQPAPAFCCLPAASRASTSASSRRAPCARSRSATTCCLAESWRPWC